MGKAKLKIDIEPSHSFKRTMLMLEQKQVALRKAAIQRYITYSTAEALLKSVQEKIPDTPQYAPYKNSLKLVQSGARRNPIFAVYSTPEAAPIEAATDLIYFKPKKKAGKIDPVVAVLLEYQPWTVTTLPFDLSPKQATLVTRKVTKRELKQVETAREADRKEVDRKLSELGITPSERKTDVPKNATAVPDLTYTALRLEFGLGGTRAVAHWRPSIRQAKAFATNLFEDDKIGRALLDWNYDRWRKWRHLSAEAIPTKKIATLGVFQSKVSK